MERCGKKESIVKELEAAGIPVDDLINSVDKKLDLFDLICHVAYDQPPLTRRERANDVKKTKLLHQIRR